ncbi:BtpA/SgcQ family protein [Bacteriovorax sp. Seq25_V]|uniref:BtpA/SgcQ family protein n=1 Tax=Bacteriovorax sp. Seq25_V TaxID=1201288 RepID=UPI00038A381D|nr:BtpA/SgcQ family protein [Bacteriovorax sp. Seq25_V]EQC45471.1 membrane complex biogenesis protein, BtpA family [Bacteriovorax sp. Seq25_V]
MNLKNKPIIAVIYLAPSLGYEKHPGMDTVFEQASEDMEVLIKCGVDAALLENENDRPYSVLARPEVIASMSVTSYQLRKEFESKITIGTEFLINDPEASLAMAKASGTKFIRTDYFVDRMAREEYGGEMRIAPLEVMNFKKKIGAEEIKLYSDIQVKYATMLEDKAIEQSAKQAIEMGSDGVIVSANLTGVAPSADDLIAIKKADESIPVLIGSGLSYNNIESLYPLCDGAMVGTALMTNYRMDYEKVAPFMDRIRSLRG